ncbi:MAG: class B sortase [Oscillospiraceae bacterium]|nr:class B sortase [Oscillospiraceae bacterium]
MRKGELRRIVSFLLAVTFIVTTGLMVEQTLDKRKARAIYEEAMAAAMAQSQITEEASVPAAATPPVSSLPALPAFSLDQADAFLQTVDITALRQTNTDVLGWLHIPGSVISYPLMRSHDNIDYLYHAWDGSPNVAGSIFLEQHNSPDFTDFNTIVYGHSMADGSMFAELHKYQWQDVPETFPYLYIAIDGAVLRYAVFACYEASISSDTYRLSFADDAAREHAIANYLTQSSVTMPLSVTAQDHVLTLSTCTGNQKDLRLVVQAVLDGILPR